MSFFTKRFFTSCGISFLVFQVLVQYLTIRDLQEQVIEIKQILSSHNLH